MKIGSNMKNIFCDDCGKKLSWDSAIAVSENTFVCSKCCNHMFVGVRNPQYAVKTKGGYYIRTRKPKLKTKVKYHTKEYSGQYFLGIGIVILLIWGIIKYKPQNV